MIDSTHFWDVYNTTGKIIKYPPIENNNTDLVTFSICVFLFFILFTKIKNASNYKHIL